ncbi:MAG TPA: TlpA disulfide reductase family protein [Kofleriaceae bacterium]|jgi:thiol-disulfide isomerase/thioredoxin
MSNVTTSTKALIGALLAGSVGVIIFLFVHLSADGKKTFDVGTAKAAACEKGEKCLPTLKFMDTTGKVYASPDALTGKVVVLNFWATWCNPCKREIPAFSKVYEKYKDKGVVFLGVLTGDNASDSDLLNFQSDNEMTYPVVRENSDIRATFMDDMENLPTTIIFDRGGKQVTRRVGGMNDQRLAEIIDPLVSQK